MASPGLLHGASLAPLIINMLTEDPGIGIGCPQRYWSCLRNPALKPRKRPIFSHPTLGAANEDDILPDIPSGGFPRGNAGELLVMVGERLARKFRSGRPLEAPGGRHQTKPRRPDVLTRTLARSHPDKAGEENDWVAIVRRARSLREKRDPEHVRRRRTPR